MFAILRGLRGFVVIEAVFHIFYSVIGAKNIVRYYKGLRYLEVRYIDVPAVKYMEKNLSITKLDFASPFGPASLYRGSPLN